MQKTQVRNWEHFHHGADIGIRGKGKTLEEAFANGALALTGVVTNPQNVSSLESIEIKLNEDDVELLFFDWINSLVFEMDTRKMLFSDFKVHIDKNSLNALVRGEKVDRPKHEPAVEIKGATFTELKVRNEADEWTAQCVVDV